MGAVDYDFKGMATYYANSMGGEITMHRGTFPHLYNQVARAQISQDELNTWFESFKEKIHRLGLKMEKSLYSPISGPLYKKTFKSFFEPLYQKAFAPFFTQLRERKLQEGTPLFSIFINVENTTLEKSGIDSGDSGGAMACKVNDQWKVVGVNSQRMDSNLAYFPEPWEPMHSQPKSRITKNGEVTPVTYEVQQWIEGLDH